MRRTRFKGVGAISVDRAGFHADIPIGRHIFESVTAVSTGCVATQDSGCRSPRQSAAHSTPATRNNPPTLIFAPFPFGLAHFNISTDPCVSQALEQIRTRACEGLSVAEVAALFGSGSRRAAELRFKSATGKTMTEALLDTRLERACQYLREGRMSITAVANFCGWTNDIPFRKAFKNKFGYLPTNLRRKRVPPAHGISKFVTTSVM